MKAQCVIAFSGKVYTTLLPEMELMELDKITSTFQNEEEFRQSEPYKTMIQDFFTKRKNYRNAIQDKRRKEGVIRIEYKGDNDYIYPLSLLYKEDLERLQMTSLDPEEFIKNIKNKVTKALKTQSDNEIARFFQKFSYLFGSISARRQGYYSFIDKLSNNYFISEAKERNKLLKLLRDGLTLNEEEKSLRLLEYYNRARRIYDDVKNKEYFPKRKVKNLKIKEEKVSHQSLTMVKDRHDGTPNFTSSKVSGFDIFVEKYCETHKEEIENFHKKYKGGFTSVAELYQEYEEQNRRGSRHE